MRKGQFLRGRDLKSGRREIPHVESFLHPRCFPDFKPINSSTPLKTNMTGWKIPMFNRQYMFKWWIFHSHVSFRGGYYIKLASQKRQPFQGLKDGGNTPQSWICDASMLGNK